ncbi:molybdopterin molybdotransferase MoeA [Gloeobacter violaceus]|uniref:Molybdopterin molybdenumtransferase n=1 Tax=Gloeobacter violaceus (strain ATCC 29082 / PCC 7421) TaxID=251221 RepID=Q7NEY8_GLOVI|nr:gephyrin-like molybdotransferase Glp [Gloeobacter violaceus]BAC91680.1 glr3739 [Gloeobacter violaceus PCC 7421]
MISVEEAQALILEAVEVGAPERVDLLAACSRVLAETILARTDFPPYDNSAMDGYAVRSADTGFGKLQVVETIAAGRMPTHPLAEGQAARIMTGAVLPEGSDAVLIQEEARLEGDTLTFEKLPAPGANVRYRGAFHKAGSPLMPPGTVLQPGEIALLAAAQRAFVLTHRPPAVAIVSTGDELVGIDGVLAGARIVDSNQYGLVAQVREAGGDPRALGIAPDDPEAIRMRLLAALDADFVLLSGGASVGQFDYTPQVLEALGAQVVLYKINMKPGKPLMFARLGSRLIWGLPGNPVSSLFCFWQFVRPAIRKFMGYPPERWRYPVVTAQLKAPVRSKGDRRAYLRGQLALEAGVWRFAPYRTDNSGDLVSLLGINAFAWLEAGVTGACEGETVPVLVVGELVNR